MVICNGFEKTKTASAHVATHKSPEASVPNVNDEDQDKASDRAESILLGLSCSRKSKKHRRFDYLIRDLSQDEGKATAGESCRSRIVGFVGR